jgi:hypothetical protein
MALAFDGASMWVANFADDTVTKLRASDGQSLGTFAVGDGPIALAFDGANVWVGNHNSRTVTKLRASDGQGLATYPVSVAPTVLAFDGASLWIGGEATGPTAPLLQMNPANGNMVASHLLPALACNNFTAIRPYELLAGGQSIWLLGGCPNDTSVVAKIRLSDGSILATRRGNAFVGMVFDGSDLWVGSWHFPAAVWKLRTSDASVLCTYSPDAQTMVESLAFDGLWVWVGTAGGPNDITLLDPATCASVGAHNAARPLTDVNAFDGVHVWTACDWGTASPTVCRL